jgi:large subunit ribosomal protein L1
LGRSRKVIVFADGDEARLAKEAGADEVGMEDLAKKIQEGWSDFDVAVALPRMMKVVGKLGKVLGPQGKMPSPKSGTVTDDIGVAVKEFKAGRVEFRNDKGGIVHAPVGKFSFQPEKIQQNIEAFLEHINSLRPPTIKGSFVLGATVSGTMTPGVSLAVQSQA